jgi:polysaccharide biosynthesis PFTS motif protein
LKACFTKKTRAPKNFIFSLTDQQVYQKGSLKELIDFFNEPRFNLNVKIENTVIECRQYHLPKFKRKDIVKFDLATYVLLNNIPRSKLNVTFREILNRTIEYLEMSTFQFKYWKRNIYDIEIWKKFNDIDDERKTLITTQSSENILPAAFLDYGKNKHYRIMFWYGTNIIPFDELKSFEGDFSSTRKHVNLPSLNKNLDAHFVWDENQKKYLEARGLTNLEIKGSILFRSRNTNQLIIKSPSIVYFDITPTLSQGGFYNAENCIANLDGLVMVTRKLKSQLGINLNLIVKPKRKYNKWHSDVYIKKLNEYQASGDLNIFNSISSIYSLVAEADLTIGIPFTSPVLIAKEMGKKGLFYTLSNFNLPTTYNDILIVKNLDQLELIIKSTLNKEVDL